VDSVQGKIVSTTRDEVRGDWRILHNEELHDLYISPDIRVIYSRRMRWAGNVARIGDRRSACKVFLERPLGKGKRRLEDDTKMCL
jgi:hypothetical protein